MTETTKTSELFDQRGARLRDRLQKLRGVELDTADRNVERAMYLRRMLRPDGNGEAEKN